MKKYIIVLMLLSMCLSSEAQKFLRYQMNNNTYNGFYTWGIESILHDYKNGIATTFVNASGKAYEIPVENIDCISVEDANINNDNIGQYRIYEFNYEEGDVKKIFVDNRASLFASHNGDFGANDTILFSSAYNGIAWIFYTDDQGRIKKIYDGNRLIFLDYDSDCEFTAIDLSTGNLEHYLLPSPKLVSHRSIFSTITTFFSQAVRILTPIGERLITPIVTGGEALVFDAGLQEINYFSGNIDELRNNPELHNQSFIVDGLSITSDIVGIVASLFGEVPSLGWSTVGVAASAGFLMHDLTELINHIWPDSEQMQSYRDYYQKKYSIHVAAIAAENVSYTSATLRGEATSFSPKGLDGTFIFKLYGENDETLSGTKNNVTNNSCIITANASKLKPGWPYFYSVQYTCVVDGLQLVFYADNIAEFMTLSPTVYTGEVQSKSSDRAEVICQFYNAPEGAICGVEYTSSYGTAEEKAPFTHEGDYYFTLSPLKPNTIYSYRAFIIIDDVYVYAEDSKTFKTDDNKPQGQTSCSDSNHPHWIDLGLPSGTLWKCCNEGANSPSKDGEYYKFGQVSSAPGVFQVMELLNYTTSVWTTQDGVKGCRFTGQNGGSIFLPASGLKWQGAKHYVGKQGNYWGGTSDGSQDSAFNIYFDASEATWEGFYDGTGWEYTVRSVSPVNH